MTSKLKWITGFLCFMFLLVSLIGGKTAVQAADINVPVKVAFLYDAANSNTNTGSSLYHSVVRVLNWNKIPFDALDISGGKHPTLLDGSGNPEYSVALVAAAGSAVDSTNSQNILAALNKGMGAVALLPETSNSALKTAFGIGTLGTQTSSSASFSILKNKFTFSYAGVIVKEDSNYRNHTLLPGADIVARFTSGNQPAIWTYDSGAGKTVYHNTTATKFMGYWGLLLQSILYAMPVGVASPANVMTLNVDDCPMTYYDDNYLQKYYYDFMSNYLRWLASYNTHSTFFVAFSYSESIYDFWASPQPLQAAADILSSGNEIGLHCGSAHVPLDPAYWGSNAKVNAEVDATNQALQLLRQRLLSQYNLTLGDITDYVAPADCITDFGYQILNSKTTIKYVGQSFAPDGINQGSSQAMVAGNMAAQSLSGPVYNSEVQPHGIAPAIPLKTQTVSPLVATTFPEVYRDFGREGSLPIYNLPRIDGGLEIFAYPQHSDYANSWSNLRTSLESGQPYLAFIHPDEADIADPEEFPGINMAKCFEAYSIWANYIATNYPFYRWMKGTQLGDYLSSRSGALSAQWNPATNALNLILAQPDDPIHIKSTKYLNSITGSGTNLVLNFVDTPTNFQSTQYDVVRVASDYFIYPLGQRALMPQVPSQPFVFQSVTPNHPPVINPIGNKQVLTGQPLTFTISGIDPDSNPLVYSAANLPAGSSFNSGTHTFNWTPATPGMFPGVRFNVSDGTYTDYEDITIVAVNSLPSSTEIIKPVAAGPDDGISGVWSYNPSDSWYEVGNPGQSYNAWFRFAGITIPRGAIILDAHLETVQNQWSSGTRLKISAEKAAAPSAPASFGDHIMRTLTSTKVNWTSGSGDNAYHSSPNFASVIGELMNNFDYSSGGVIQVLVDDNGSQTGSEHFGQTFETGNPPRLYIKYETPSVTISGTTCETKGTILGGVTLMLDNSITTTSDTNGNYRLLGVTAGAHTLVASKSGYRPQTLTINAADPFAPYVADFKGVNSLVPNAPDMFYALDCITLWLYPPSDGTGLDMFKVLDVIGAWKFPL